MCFLVTYLLKMPLNHYWLGHWLEKKGNREEALREYRAAYGLNPSLQWVKAAYERLLRKVR